jgi:type I restriction enzyme M protein
MRFCIEKEVPLMATRPYFFIKNQKVVERFANFEWVPGLHISRKKMNVRNLHAAIPMKTLEVSTKSDEALGVKLSAFSLIYDEGIKLESYYQASKVFDNGGPFRDIAFKSPKEAKSDPRLKTSGKFIGFYDVDEDQKWGLGEPYYDYIYIKTAFKNLSDEELEQLASYDAFTDIEFNPAKSYNTQARAIAILKLLYSIFGRVELNKNDFVAFEKMYVSI